MGLQEVNQQLLAAERATGEMKKRATGAEAAASACTEHLAKIIQYLQETIRPLLREAIEAREEGIKELRAASETYGDARLHLQAAKLRDGHPVVEGINLIGEQLEPAKRRILTEVFVSEEDVLEGLHGDVKGNEAGLNDVRLHLGSLLQPHGEVLQLKEEISTVGSAIAAYKKGANP